MKIFWLASNHGLPSMCLIYFALQKTLLTHACRHIYRAEILSVNDYWSSGIYRYNALQHPV
jgi:hypothetical protein